LGKNIPTMPANWVYPSLWWEKGHHWIGRPIIFLVFRNFKSTYMETLALPVLHRRRLPGIY